MPKQQQDDLKRELGKALIDQTIGIRQRKRVVEENWLQSRRMWMNASFRSFQASDSSRNVNNIPAGRRAIERTVVRGVKLLTPQVKWFEATPLSDISAEKISNVDTYMWYTLRKKIRSRSNINLLIRCMVLYGRCFIKTGVAVRNGQVWPTQRVIDPFAFYTYPETAATLDDADVVFEDFLFSYEKYNTFVRLGIVEPISRSDLTKPDWPYHLVERLAYQGITDPTADVQMQMEKIGDSLQNIGAGFVSLTEKWITRNDKLYQVYTAWNVKGGPRVVGFIESEYDEPMIRGTIHRPLPGETYTNSMADDITTLDSLQNDNINMFQDAVDWEQGFVAFGGDGAMNLRRDSFKMKGRAKWDFGDVMPREAIQFINPPDTSSNILRAWQVCSGLINSLAGTGTIAEGQPGRNMPRSGSAVNNLVNLSMADVQDLAELVEQEVLTPSLSDIYKVSTKFIPDEQLMRIPGGKGLFQGKTVSSIVTKEDILGDYEFEWIGSLQSQDEEARSQRLLIFLNLMMNPQMVAGLQQQGYAPDLVELVRQVWRSGMGERGLHDVVVSLAELQMKAQRAQAEQQLTLSQQVVQGGGAGQQTVPSQGQNGANTNGNSVPSTNGVAGLNYTLPSATQGFVKR